MTTDQFIEKYGRPYPHIPKERMVGGLDYWCACNACMRVDLEQLTTGGGNDDVY